MSGTRRKNRNEPSDDEFRSPPQRLKTEPATEAAHEDIEELQEVSLMDSLDVAQTPAGSSLLPLLGPAPQPPPQPTQELQLLEMPSDVLSVIASHLSIRQALDGMALTCTQLRDAVYDGVTEVRVTQSDVDLGHLKALRSVIVDYVRPTSYEWLTRFQDTLESLEIRGLERTLPL